MRDRLEVWGDPIAHSLSPALHAAAYAALGNGWSYGRRRVGEEAFATELAGVGADFRGLSLTMPLKGAAFAVAEVRDRRAELTGAVNTLVLTGGARLGANTDVGGLVAALGDLGVEAVGRGRIVGAGATAMSALVALGELGATHVDIAARRPEAVIPLVELGRRLDVVVHGTPLAAGWSPVDVTIATLPGDAAVSPVMAESLAVGGPLLDVVYGSWPTPLATAWGHAGLPAASGLGMLLHQAVLQIRLFTSGDAHQPLPDEPAVLAAMRSALPSLA